MMVQVELFGLARLLAGAPRLEVSLPDDATLRDIVPALAGLCPALVGVALLRDLSGLESGYTFSLNGRSFVADLETRLAPDDAVLLLPAAGGG